MGPSSWATCPSPRGDAALERAIEEAKLRGDKLVVVNSHRGGREYDAETAAKDDQQMESVKKRLEDSAWSTTCASWSAASSPPRT